MDSNVKKSLDNSRGLPCGLSGNCFFLIKIIFLVLPFIFIANSVVIAGGKNLSQARAKELLEQHISKAYSGVEIGANKYNTLHWEQKTIITIIKRYNILQSEGLITYTVNARHNEMFFNAVETENVKDSPHFIKTINKDKYLFLLIGSRKILKITKTDSKNFVYFVYSFEPSEMGFLLELTRDEKNRGRAKIVYDDFLERFIFKGFEFSAWEEEKWRDGSWVDFKNNDTIVNRGIVE